MLGLLLTLSTGLMATIVDHAHAVNLKEQQLLKKELQEASDTTGIAFNLYYLSQASQMGNYIEEIQHQQSTVYLIFMQFNDQPAELSILFSPDINTLSLDTKISYLMVAVKPGLVGTHLYYATSEVIGNLETMIVHAQSVGTMQKFDHVRPLVFWPWVLGFVAVNVALMAGGAALYYRRRVK